MGRQAVEAREGGLLMTTSLSLCVCVSSDVMSRGAIAVIYCAGSREIWGGNSFKQVDAEGVENAVLAAQLSGCKSDGRCITSSSSCCCWGCWWCSECVASKVGVVPCDCVVTCFVCDVCAQTPATRASLRPCASSCCCRPLA